MSRSHTPVIVIGSGFGGLSAAIRLAAAGHRVQLFEKRDKPGGRAYEYEIDGFHFDGGPTVITAPYLFDELFALAGKKREDYLEFLPIDPFYRIFDEEGRVFNHWRDHNQAAAEIARFSPRDVGGYRRFIGDTGYVFRNFHPYTERHFLQLSRMVRILPFMFSTNTWLSMYQYAARYVKDDFIRRVLSFHPLLIGGNPYATPAIYSLIIEFEREWGIHYARGGTGAIVRALVGLLQELGGSITYNAEVAEILVEGKRAVGVRLADGSLYRSDVVVCNGDAAFAWKNLIAPRHRPAALNFYIEHQQYSNSLVVLYFGTNRRYNDGSLAHHNLIFGSDYRNMMRDVFRRKKLGKDFLLYLHVPSLTDPGMAPEGCESFYALSIVPHLDARVDWQEINDAYCDGILQYLESRYIPGLRQHLAVRHNINPVHFRDTLNSYKGAAFAAHPSLMQSGWARLHNRSSVIPNLYFVGAGTHPGAGVPAVIASGKIAAQLIDPEIGRYSESQHSNTTAIA
jgi:phytoene desaturase